MTLRSALYIISSRIAPTIEAKKLAPPPSEYHPAARPIQVATTAPPIPISVVIIKPPGSLPGMINFARAPTIKPTIIAHIKCINIPPLISGAKY
jgi:hypothetical protein